MQRKFLLCAAVGVLAAAIACGKSSSAPTSPSTTGDSGTAAAADGSTLKVPAPNALSPTGGATADDPLTLTASTVKGKFATINPQYRFQVRSGSNVVTTGVVGPTTDGSVSFQPIVDSDTTYTWRVQATLNGANGPWSADANFKSPVGAFIRGNEVRDPLTIGRTVGEIRNATQFTPDGLKLLTHESHVLYRLQQNLQAGQFSMMIKGADEGSEGDKSKVFAMQEGPEENDITTDDYRMSAELRGSLYPQPGSISCRIIFGDGVSRDCPRSQKNFDSSRWYFWSFSWTTGNARLQVRLDNENGPLIYDTAVEPGGGSHPYRPDLHFAYLGSPAGRAGLLDATLPGGTYKNVYIGPGPRPAFAQ
jgi:hypothetical protein